MVHVHYFDMIENGLTWKSKWWVDVVVFANIIELLCEILQRCT